MVDSLTVENVKELYAPSNSFEYIFLTVISVTIIVALYKYFSGRREDKPTSDIKEDLKEIKESIKDISKYQIDIGLKLARDYQRLNENDNKNETLFEFMNEANRDIAELKVR